jgi:dihydroflavonol-4-reductase
MKIFVTGGNGFIGSALVRQLVERGHRVVCLLRSGSQCDRIQDLRFDIVRGDVCDAPSFRAAMFDCDAAIHLAAPGGWTQDDGRTLDAVIDGGTANLLAVAERMPERRLVIVSSTAAVNGSDEPCVFDETAEFTVRDPALQYAHAKHRAERRAGAAAARGVNVVIVNPAEVYGPNDTALGTASNLIEFATSRPVLVCRGGTGVVHVDDVVAGIIAALHRGRAGERYILSGENLTIRQLASLVLDLVDRTTPIVEVPNGIARSMARLVGRLRLPAPFNPAVVPYATRYWFVDNTKARRELRVAFRGARETVRDAIGWLQTSGLLSGGEFRAPVASGAVSRQRH